MNIQKLNNLSFTEANKIIVDFCQSAEHISDKDLNQMLNLSELELIATFLEEYQKFTNAQLIVLERFINENLNIDNYDFVSDLIDFSSNWALNIDYKKLLKFLNFQDEKYHFVVLSTIGYITENVKLFYIDDIIKGMEKILDNPNFFQNVQIGAALCLYRITHNKVYLKDIEDWFDDENNRVFLQNTLKSPYYRKDYFYPNLNDLLLK